MRLFTLRNKAVEDASILNGKILTIRKDKESKHLVFSDILTDTPLWETSSVVKEFETSDGITFITNSGTEYDFINVSTLLPTYEAAPAEDKEDEILLFNGEYESTIKRLSDLTPITDFLMNSSDENSSLYNIIAVKKYLKLFGYYIEELEELKNQLDWKASYLTNLEDDDEFFANARRKFARIFDEYVNNNIIEALFKVKKEDKFSAELLKVIYSYLDNNGIYTKKVNLGSKFKNINFMSVIPEVTSDETKHKDIIYINRPAFFAEYKNENGKTKESLLSKGVCVVLTFKK